MNKTTYQQLGTLAIAMAAFLVFAFAPIAYAADLDGFDTIDTFSGYGFDSVDTFSSFGFDTVDTFTSSYGFDTIDTFTPASYYSSYYTPTSYWTPSYGGSGLSYSTPGYYGGGYGGYGGSSVSYSPTYTSTNTCTATNSCNTTYTYDDHSVYTVTNTTSGGSSSYPVYYPVYQQPSVYYGAAVYDMCPNLAGTQQVLPSGYYIQNGYCYANFQPTVTVAAVPYTGLEMGPVGTALYWGFLVLWSLLAAYLVVVKRVHYRIAAWFMQREAEAPAHAHKAPAHAPAAKKEEHANHTIDSFIASQIHRARS